MIKSKLKILLALNDMNQSELATRTGIRPQTITNIVNNKIRQIPVDALNAICEVLHCDVGDVFGYVDIDTEAERQEEPTKTTETEPPKAAEELENLKRLQELQEMIDRRKKES